MADIANAYQQVMRQYKNISVLGEVTSVLFWDQLVMMPPKGLAARSESVALIEGLTHKHTVDPAFVENVNLLAANSTELDDDQKVNVREIKRVVDRAVKVPQELVEEITRQASLTHAAWEKARAASDFAAFAPKLQRMVELQIEKAKALGGDNPYDVMIDGFEPGATEAQISEVFAKLRERLVPFVHRITERPKPDVSMVYGPTFDTAKQREFGLSAVKAMGYDFDGGRQDVSVHPFCTGRVGDVRITTRFVEHDMRQAFFGMMHEAGHALYEQGQPEAHAHTPLSEHISMAIHESQSRMWENMVGRSLPFWKSFYPKARETFPHLKNVSIEDFYRAINVVEGSLIRVEADEATYQLHIILRFEIESDLIAGRISVNDLPEIWNRKMADYLGVEVPDDAAGVLQDVHWSEGLFGYFPTYCLGNLYAAQFFAKARKDVPGLDTDFEKGDFSRLLGWLRENIHRHGKRYSAGELVERVTGSPLSPDAFMDYLEAKYEKM